jgi:hypothetical protein
MKMSAILAVYGWNSGQVKCSISHLCGIMLQNRLVIARKTGESGLAGGKARHISARAAKPCRAGAERARCAQSHSCQDLS